MRRTDQERAKDFIHREGRVLERRILEATFEGRPPQGVSDALLAYRNPDGGFGYGLEPDKRAPESQPLDVEIAWHSLDWVGLAPADLVVPACDYLASLGPGVSCVTPSVLQHPHAPHWTGASYDPDLNPTAGLAGYLWKWGIDHPWRDAATSFCWSTLAEGPPDEAHTAICVLRFLAHVPDRARATEVMRAWQPTLPKLSLLHYEPTADSYGVSPLQLVPEPADVWRGLFGTDVLDAHLDFLERTQADDGGWEITWATIGPAAISEWRTRRTLENLLVLRAYGRLD